MIFPVYRKEMKGIKWGILFNKFKNKSLDANILEKEIQSLMQDDDVSNKKGIYIFVLDREEKHLNIRAFSQSIKRHVYEKQQGLCSHCHRHFSFDEMEADHIVPWHEGGKTEIENCQMLCKNCNRRKSGK